MSKFDTFYRAFHDYRKYTEDNTECKKDRKEVKQVNIEGDKLEAVRLLCTIEEDWISEIEKGLEFVDKALREERQFIRSNGEVVPIAKAKRVSKASVEHLARHSNMILHVPEKKGGKIIPDNIFIVEKLSDYTVYENRFLYMLLCYLRDFINLRLEKIIEISNTYRGMFTMKKTIHTKIKDLTYETNFFEERKDNPFPIDNPKSQILLRRIQIISSAVISYLQSSLMSQVSKAPMIKPPIIKTNILRMDNNFKGAVALYEYVASYTKDGYTFEEVKKTYHPFTSEISDEVTELISLTSFLTYEYGNELKSTFKKNFDEEEKKRKEEENQLLVSQIKNLKRRIFEQGYSPEEYMLLLEKRNRILEGDHEQLLESYKTIENLKKHIEQLNEDINNLKVKISKLEQIIVNKDKEIAYLKQKYIDDMARKEEEHRVHIVKLKEEFRLKLEELEKNHLEEINKLNENHLQEINKINEQHVNEINDLIRKNNNDIVELSNNYQTEIGMLNQNHQVEMNTTIEKFENKFNKTTDELKSKINNLENYYTKEIEDINNNNSKEKERLINSYSVEKEKLINSYSVEKKKLIHSYDSEKEKLNNKHSSEKEKLSSCINKLNKNLINVKTTNDELKDEFNKKIVDLKDIINKNKKEYNRLSKDHEINTKNIEKNYINKIDELDKLFMSEKKNKDKKISQLYKEKLMVMGQLTGIREKYGLIKSSDDYVSFEAFEQLEKEYLAFKYLFKRKWKEVKRLIKEKSLGIKIKAKDCEPYKENQKKLKANTLIKKMYSSEKFENQDIKKKNLKENNIIKKEIMNKPTKSRKIISTDNNLKNDFIKEVNENEINQDFNNKDKEE